MVCRLHFSSPQKLLLAQPPCLYQKIMPPPLQDKKLYCNLIAGADNKGKDYVFSLLYRTLLDWGWRQGTEIILQNYPNKTYRNLVLDVDNLSDIFSLLGQGAISFFQKKYQTRLDGKKRVLIFTTLAKMMPRSDFLKFLQANPLQKYYSEDFVKHWVELVATACQSQEDIALFINQIEIIDIKNRRDFFNLFYTHLVNQRKDFDFDTYEKKRNGSYFFGQPIDYALYGSDSRCRSLFWEQLKSDLYKNLGIYLTQIISKGWLVDYPRSLSIMDIQNCLLQENNTLRFPAPKEPHPLQQVLDYLNQEQITLRENKEKDMFPPRETRYSHVVSDLAVYEFLVSSPTPIQTLARIQKYQAANHSLIQKEDIFLKLTVIELLRRTGQVEEAQRLSYLLLRQIPVYYRPSCEQEFPADLPIQAGKIETEKDRTNFDLAYLLGRNPDICQIIKKDYLRDQSSFSSQERDELLFELAAIVNDSELHQAVLDNNPTALDLNWDRLKQLTTRPQLLDQVLVKIRKESQATVFSRNTLLKKFLFMLRCIGTEKQKNDAPPQLLKNIQEILLAIKDMRGLPADYYAALGNFCEQEALPILNQNLQTAKSYQHQNLTINFIQSDVLIALAKIKQRLRGSGVAQ